MNLRIETQHHELSADEREHIDVNLRALRGAVRDFPVALLQVRIDHQPRSGEFHVKASLDLPRRTIFTGERHAQFHPAFERCVRKLIDKVRAYQEQLTDEAMHERVLAGTWHAMHPSESVDRGALETAARADDPATFRRSMTGHEGDLEQQSIDPAVEPVLARPTARQELA